jgi:cation transport ATPase
LEEVNDAISLAAAGVGISIGRAKADLAIKSSDITYFEGRMVMVIFFRQDSPAALRSWPV